MPLVPEQIRIGIANYILNRAYDCYFADLEPKTIFSYLPKSLTRRGAQVMAEKVAHMARNGMRRSIQERQEENIINEWDKTNGEAAQILFNIHITQRRGTSP